MRFVIFRHHQTAARFFVETVNDSRTLLAANSGKCFAMIEQRVDQGVLTMTSPRMNYHAGGLVDYDEICIFKKNVERDLLWLIVDLFQRRLDEIDLVTRTYEIARTRRFAFEFDESRTNQLLNSRARELIQLTGEKTIEARTRRVTWNGENDCCLFRRAQIKLGFD